MDPVNLLESLTAVITKFGQLDLDHRVGKLETWQLRLDIARGRLARWAEALRLRGMPTDPGILGLIEQILTQLNSIFDDTITKYGLASPVRESSDQYDSDQYPSDPSHRLLHSILNSRLRSPDASILTRMRFLLSDKRRLSYVMSQITALIAQLEALVPLEVTRRHLAKEEVDKIRDKESLQLLLLEAGTDDQILWDAVQQKLNSGTEESNRPGSNSPGANSPGSQAKVPISAAPTPLFPITIHGITLDSNDTSLSSDKPQSNYVVIQTHMRLSPEQKRGLAELGLSVHEYVCKNTYLCGYQGSDLDMIRQLDYIGYVGIYGIIFKMSSSLKEVKLDAFHKVDAIFHNGVDSEQTNLRALVAQKAHVGPDELMFYPHKVRLTVQGHYLHDLASIDEVRHIEEVRGIEYRNDHARLILEAPVQPDHSNTANYTYAGEGQVIAVADSGLDSQHPAFGDRVLALIPLGSPSADDFLGHGTHVCGSAVGDGVAVGNIHIMGTAPKARLVVQSLGSHAQGLPGDMTQLLGPPYFDHGARVHSNSWGTPYNGTQNEYGDNGRQIDAFIWNYPEMVVCFAAGNDASDREGVGVIFGSQIGAEAAAKNCITVGASENYRENEDTTYFMLNSSSFPLPPISLRRMAADSSLVAAFSSRGPTREGRIKPDVVAPGTCILSANSRHVTNPDYPGPDANWCYDSGTSMATPLVAGSAAVLREALIMNGTPNPSAALIKALIINGAVILPKFAASQYLLPSTPNTESGFGRVNLANSMAVACGGDRKGFHEGQIEENNNPPPLQIHVDPPLTTLKVTLVWSDPPGEAIRNSIRLEVQNGIGQILGIGNTDNNIQQVLWKGTSSGHIIIRVIPNETYLDEYPQPYAVVWEAS